MLDIYCTNWGHADINYMTYLGLEYWLLGLALRLYGSYCVLRLNLKYMCCLGLGIVDLVADKWDGWSCVGIKIWVVTNKLGTGIS